MFQLVATTDTLSKLSQEFETREAAVQFGRDNWPRIQRAGTVILQIRSCGALETIWRKPIPVNEIPASYYAFEEKRYHLDRPADGKYAGWTFLVTGSDYRDRTTLAMVTPSNHVVKATDRGRIVLDAIAQDPFARASEYGAITGKCAACGRKLEDPESRRLGLGPICRQKFGM